MFRLGNAVCKLSRSKCTVFYKKRIVLTFKNLYSIPNPDSNLGFWVLLLYSYVIRAAKDLKAHISYKNVNFVKKEYFFCFKTFIPFSILISILIYEISTLMVIGQVKREIQFDESDTYSQMTLCYCKMTIRLQ